ncbi:C25 family cysteine peptidase [Thermoplasmatota archaeon]
MKGKKKINSNKIIAKSILITLSLLMISIFSNISLANTEKIQNNNYINQTYKFNTPTIEKIIIKEEIYDRISFSNTINIGEPNEPCLPVKGAYILLPKNYDINKIIVERNNAIYLGSNYVIEPTSTPIPISKQNSDTINPPKPKKEVYASTNQYPNQNYTKIGIYRFRGYSILVLELYPVKYYPKNGELYFYPELIVNIEMFENENDNSLFRDLLRDEKEVLSKIDNPNVIDSYILNNEISSYGLDDLNLLILTTNDLRNSFNELKNYHNAEGINTEIVTLEEINANNPENIREYIREVYTTRGIDYLLIGGDDGVIPAKNLWVYGLDEETTPYTTYMPSDLYYSCLDGPFNYDNDDKWGEPNDGENGNDIDLFAEVYVGRACVDNIEEVENFVEKTISYIHLHNEKDPYINEVLLLGENLGNYGIASWSGNYLDQLIDNSTDDGYSTLGIPSDIYNIITMYDREQSWSMNDIIEYVNNNDMFIINHDGHSNYHYNMRLANDDVNYLENDKPIFIYSQGCNAGGFDSTDCIAESYTVKTDSAAFSGIWNARYGWFWAYSTDGDSQRFNREFWDAVFGENIPEIGKANQDSKEDNLYLIGRSCIRWCYYQLNLFGDPSVSFFYNKPKKPETPTGQKTGEARLEYNYSTKTTDPNNDQLYYKWDFGDGNISNWIGPINSGEICTIKYQWNKGEYNIQVKAKDTNGDESPWSDSLPITMPRNERIKNYFVYYLDKLFDFIIKFNLNI